MLTTVTSDVTIVISKPVTFVTKVVYGETCGLSREKKMLIESLKQLQRTYNWSQGQMARELGISRPLLSLIYTGKRKIRAKTLSGIVSRFPELKPQVLKTLGQLRPGLKGVSTK